MTASEALPAIDPAAGATPTPDARTGELIPSGPMISIGARGRRDRVPARPVVLAARVLIAVAFVAGWQWLPDVPAIAEHVRVLNHDYVSSPADVLQRSWSLLTGSGAEVFWPAFGNTMQATLVGLLIGAGVGGVLGLALSQSAFAARVLKPFISAVNSMPLIAFIPIIVVIFGVTLKASTLSAALLSVFVVFFNAIEGGRSVRPEVIDNARLLGAGRLALLFRIRFPLVLAWTFAALPAAISFALVGAVSTEFLIGVPGLGKLLLLALSSLDAALTFAFALVLAVSGAVLVGLVTLLRNRVLHWWGRG